MRLHKLLIKNDFDIKNYTSFKIGGKIKEIYFPESLDDLKDLPTASVVVGNLSNTLVSSYGVDFPVFSTSKLDKITIDGTKVIAGAGVKGPKLAQTVAEYGLSGLEFMIGFPGSVGGEVYMNAGAHGQAVSDVFKSAIVKGEEKDFITLNKEDMNFSYRHSICQDKRYIVLQAEFELIKRDVEEIKKQMNENLEFRKAHQPSLSLPNCGSVFKNPEGESAGRLLDSCGVKELKFGGAKVWENHANFIVNDGNATSTDVLKLMCEMKKRVKEKFNITLMPEICFLGHKNKEEEKLCQILYLQ